VALVVISLSRSNAKYRAFDWVSLKLALTHRSVDAPHLHLHLQPRTPQRHN
jgi:hypothetical protein